MKLILIFLLNASCCLICFSQKTRINIRDSSIILSPNTVAYDLKIDENNKFSERLPFRKINFFDVRYDTSFIAINWQVSTQMKVGRIFKKKLTLTGGLAASLTQYFNTLYKSNFSIQNCELLCFIKKFSITLKNSLSQNEYFQGGSNNVNLEIECYYTSGTSLFPAIRFDTTYEEKKSNMYQTFSLLINNMVHPFIGRLRSMDSSAVVKRKPYTAEQIQKRYQSRFDLPILTADQYVKGVYKNFKEFKNNVPSISNFKIKSKGWMVSLYDSAGNTINALNIFGFCDGNTCWIQHGVFCYPLVRFGNSFEFLYQVPVQTQSPLADYLFPTYKFLVALDMETGKLN